MAPAAATEPPWLSHQRREGQRRFAPPSVKMEAWRFTNLRLLRDLPAAAPNAPAMPAETAAEPALRLVIDNGAVRARPGPLPAGLWFAPLAETLTQRPQLVQDALTTIGEPFADLSLALFRDGYVLALEPGLRITSPIEVLCLASEGARHIRGLISLGAGAEAALFERHASTGSGWTNLATTAALGQAARLCHVKLQDESSEAVHLGHNLVNLAAAAELETVLFAFGAQLSRETMDVRLNGPDAHFTLRSAYLLDGAREADILPVVRHLAPHCRSEQQVKGVLGGSAHGVFLGHIEVAPGADGTDARQTNRNLLVSPTARVDTRPKLEILADDVKCSHGATVGDLDPQALFYLLSRGIRPQAARRLLIEAFATDLIDQAAMPEALREVLHARLTSWAESLS